MKEFLSSLDLQDFWDDIPEQIGLWFDNTTSKLSLFLEPLYQKILANPLLAGAILLTLIGIPLIFLKIQKIKSEAETETDSDGRLDQLMEEMRNFEIKTPLIDLQKNFSGAPITNMKPRDEENSFKFNFESDQEYPDSNSAIETLDFDTMIELPSLISNEENSENETFRPTEERETAGISLSTDSTEYQFQLDDNRLELDGLPEQVSDWSQISRPALSGYDDTELSIEGIESLQQQLDESIHEVTLDLPSEQEQEEDSKQEIQFDSASPVAEPVEPTSQDEAIEETASVFEEEIHYQEEDSLLQSIDPVATELEEEQGLSVTEDDHLITRQETFNESFDNRVQSVVAAPEKIIKESQFPQSLPLKSVMKSQLPSNHTRIKAPGKNYKEILESFILLKDQKK